MRVRVYRNLSRKCWSVMSSETGLIVAYKTELVLADATFTVQPSGNARCRREQCKNVHAFVNGTIVEDSGFAGRKVDYNPYTSTTFVDDDGCPVHKAEFVRLDKHFKCSFI